MTYTKCDLCGSDDYIVIEAMGNLAQPVTNVCCRICGLVYINPVMDENKLKDFYNSSQYFSDHQNVSNKKDLSYFEKETKLGANDRYRYLKRYSIIQPVFNILEIGCASGSLLEVFKKEGYTVSGIEPSVELSHLCLKKGLNVFQGLLEDYNIEQTSPPYDFVIMFHVLEHFKSPLSAMKKIRGLLRDGGKVIIEVPDIWNLWGDPHTGMDYIFTGAHPVTFSEKTLQILGMRTGFTVNFLPRVSPISSKNMIAEFIADKEPSDEVDYTKTRDDYREVINNVFKYRKIYGWKQRLFTNTRIRRVEVLVTHLIGEGGRRKVRWILKKTGIIPLIQRVQ